MFKSWFNVSLCCSSNGIPVTAPTPSSRGTNSNKEELDKTVHDNIKDLLETHLITRSCSCIGYNEAFTQFMMDTRDANRELLVVLFQHDNKVFAALVKYDQDPDQNDVKKTLTDTISFSENPLEVTVSEKGPPMYVTYVGLNTNSQYKVSNALNECFPNNMHQQTIPKFSDFKKKTSVSIPKAIPMEDSLNFSTSIPKEAYNRPGASAPLQASPIPAPPQTKAESVKVFQCCPLNDQSDPVPVHNNPNNVH